MIHATENEKKAKGSRPQDKIQSLKGAVKSFFLVLVVLTGLCFIVATGGGGGSGSSSSSSGTISGSGQ